MIVIQSEEGILVKFWLCNLTAVSWLVDRLAVNCRFARLRLVIEKFKDRGAVLVDGLEEGDPALDVDKSHACEQHRHLAKHVLVQVMLAREYVVQRVENLQIRSHLELLQPRKTLKDTHLVLFDKLLDVRIVHYLIQI